MAESTPRRTIIIIVIFFFSAAPHRATKRVHWESDERLARTLGLALTPEALWDDSMPPPPRGSNPAALQAEEAATTATRLAPTIACEDFMVREQGGRYIVLLPVAQSPTGLVVMVPTDNDVARFGVELNPLTPAKDQAERAARHLTVGLETQYICTARDNGDIIVCVPWDECPMAYASKPAGIATARTAGHRTVWASVSALAGLAAYAFATLASLRMQTMQGSSLGDDLVVGIHNTARPVVTQREAARYARAQSVLSASEEWTTFLASERLAGDDIASALRAEDEGDGVLRHLADKWAQLRTLEESCRRQNKACPASGTIACGYTRIRRGRRRSSRLGFSACQPRACLQASNRCRGPTSCNGGRAG